MHAMPGSWRKAETAGSEGSGIELWDGAIG